MMDALYPLMIVTPKQVILEETVRSLVAPGEIGSLGVLAHHAPLMTTLSAGRLSIVLASGETKIFQIAPGFLDVSRERVTLLTPSADEQGH